MQRKIGIIIMLSAFSVSAMAGGEVRLGKSKAYDNEYELVAEHEVNEEGSQLNQDEYAAHPIVRSWRICHSFAEILTLLKISAVPNKLQFRNENKSDDTVAFYFTNYIRPILHWFYQFYFFRPYKPIQVE